MNATNARRAPWAGRKVAVDVTAAAQRAGPDGTLAVVAPLSGQIVALEDVPDEAFATGALGPGLAVEPVEGVVVAPVDGVVAAIVSTGHAVGFIGPGGIELLVHVGIDTVRVPDVGRFFKFLVRHGDAVEAGQPVADFDLEGLRGTGATLVSPVVLTGPPGEARVAFTGAPSEVIAGIDVVFTVVWDL